MQKNRDVVGGVLRVERGCGGVEGGRERWWRRSDMAWIQRLAGWSSVRTCRGQSHVDYNQISFGWSTSASHLALPAHCSLSPLPLNLALPSSPILCKYTRLHLPICVQEC